MSGIVIDGLRWEVRARWQNIARLAITDRGLSFTPNGDRGVLICFATPVRGLDPFGVLRHPELTVGVAEPERLLACLSKAVTT